MSPRRSPLDGSEVPLGNDERCGRRTEGRERAPHEMTDAEIRLRARVALAVYAFGVAVVGGVLIIDGCVA
jgi:hypothetical protein